MKRLFLFILPLFITSCQTKLPVLHLFSWAEFISPEVIQAFEKKYHCKVYNDYFESNEAMYAKLKAGHTDYDLITPSNYMVEIMTDQDMLEILDLDLIPNIKNLDPHYTNYLPKSKKFCSLTYVFTYSMVGYNKERIHDPDPSWSLFNSTSFKRRMTLLNDPRETLGSALLYLGYDPNTLNQTEINQAKELVIQWSKNLAKFENVQYKTGLDSGEFLAVHGYSGDFLKVMLENPKISFFIPKEGFLVSTEDFAIPTTTPQKQLAHAFINHMLEPKMAALNMEYTSFNCPNLPAYKYLPEELKDNPAIFLTKEELERAYFIHDLKENNRLYNEAWSEVLNTSP